MSQPDPSFVQQSASLYEVDADLHDANDALQGLMTLLLACDPAQPVLAGSLRGLLQPIAASVSTAAETLGIAHQ